jgi:hypothetical protein
VSDEADWSDESDSITLTKHLCSPGTSSIPRIYNPLARLGAQSAIAWVWHIPVAIHEVVLQWFS